MTGRPVRVALFPDSLNEVNGVANTCRNWVAYVHRNQFPMLLVSAADKTRIPPGRHHLPPRPQARPHLVRRGKRSSLRRCPGGLSPPQEGGRGTPRVPSRGRTHHRAQRHWHDGRIDGPQHLGIPIAASWQTNIHEYAARRADLHPAAMVLRHAARPAAADHRRPQLPPRRSLLQGGPLPLRAQPGTHRQAAAPPPAGPAR